MLERFGEALPPGTQAVGVGLVVTGIMAYAFLILTARVLGPERYVPLSVLWAAIFVCGPGLFLPLQQEVGRLFAHRRLEGTGAGPVLRRAALAGSGLAAAVLVLVVVFAGPIDHHLFNGQSLLLGGFVLSLIGYLLLSLLWGALAGAGRFGHYAVALSGDSILRIVGCVVLAAVGVRSVGPYGLVLGLTPIVAATVVFLCNTDLFAPGPAISTRDLTAALGWLLVGSLGAQLLANGPIIAVKLLAPSHSQARAGHFLAGLVVARVPLFLFGAVQASLLPRLAAQARAGLVTQFRSGLTKVVLLVSGIAVFATLGSFALGPTVVRLFFGRSFALGRVDLTLLAAASGAYMLMLVAVQALIALGLHARSAVGWLVGLATFAIVTGLGHALLTRVEVGFLCGVLAALACALVLLWPRLAGIEQAIDPSKLEIAPSELGLEP